MSHVASHHLILTHHLEHYTIHPPKARDVPLFSYIVYVHFQKVVADIVFPNEISQYTSHMLAQWKLPRAPKYLFEGAYGGLHQMNKQTIATWHPYIGQDSLKFHMESIVRHHKNERQRAPYILGKDAQLS